MSIEKELKEANQGSLSDSVKAKQNAAQFFLRIAQKSPHNEIAGIEQSTLCELSLHALSSLLTCDDNESRVWSARAIALLSANENYRPRICESGLLRVLFDCLKQHTEESILEGCLAALTKLCENGFYLWLVPADAISNQSVVKLLHHKCSGVQVNALALLITLVQDAVNADLVIESGILETLFNLRHGKFPSDVRENANILLRQLGCDSEPPPEHHAVTEQLRNFGYSDGKIDIARKYTGSNDPMVLANFITDREDAKTLPMKPHKRAKDLTVASPQRNFRTQSSPAKPNRISMTPPGIKRDIPRPPLEPVRSWPAAKSRIQQLRREGNNGRTYRPRAFSGSFDKGSYSDYSDDDSINGIDWVDTDAEAVRALVNESHDAYEVRKVLGYTKGSMDKARMFLNIKEMSFPIKQIKRALETTNWNYERAVNMLLTEPASLPRPNHSPHTRSRSSPANLGGPIFDVNKLPIVSELDHELKVDDFLYSRDPATTEFLTNIGLQKYIPMFSEQSITLKLLRETSSDLVRDLLKDVCINVGDVARIQEALRRKSISKYIHIGILVSNPLASLEPPGLSKQLSFAAEKKILYEAFDESKRKLKVRFAVATENNLLKLMQLGARVLHYSGHGKAKCSLLLENERGGEYDLKVERLKSAMEAAKEIKLRFVFVSSCFSSQAAKAFVDAGVPHVIAVDQESRIKDSTALQFARHVYSSLARGETVQKAFDNGRAGIIIQDSRAPCCCSHLHKDDCRICPACKVYVCCTDKNHIRQHCHDTTICCSPDLPHDEHDKFLLLPREADHYESILEDVPEGCWENVTPLLPPTNLKSLPDEFQGRGRDVKAVVEMVMKVRLSTIVGPVGIGTTSVARAVGHFLNERSVFRDGIFEAFLDNCDETFDITHAIAKALNIPYKGDDQLFSDICKKNMLFIFDAVSDCRRDSNSFQLFLERFFEESKSIKILCTCNTITAAAPMVAGVNQKIHPLKPLHSMDAAYLLYSRLARPFPKDSDFPNGGKPRNHQEMSQLRIFREYLHGNPALIERCSDLMNYVTYHELMTLLLEGDHSKWNPPPNVAPNIVERIKQFQRQCHGLGKLLGKFSVAPSQIERF